MHKNTLTKGQVRTLVFREDDTWFGVALEFGFVVQAKTREQAMYELQEVINGYRLDAEELQNCDLLNQVPDPEYLELWEKAQAGELIPSPIQVAVTSTEFIAA